ncbi:MAG: hypothetical protein ACK2U9_22395, partial [Anaerolineae bacterium]
MTSDADRGHLHDLLDRQQWDALARELSALHPADAADFIEATPDELHERLFALLPEAAQSDVLTEL